MEIITLLSLVGTTDPGILVGRAVGWIQFGASALAILAFLIIVHEFGHFIVGRLLGVRVEKFSVGFGKTIISRKVGETEYILAWIPLGGYVKFFGDEMSDHEDMPEGSFLSQPVWKRLPIVAAGPVFNFGLAAVILSIAFMYGIDKPIRVVAKVMAGDPAEVAGILPGDRIDAVGEINVESWDQVRDAIHKSPGKEITISIQRSSGRMKNVKIIPKVFNTKTIDGQKITIGLIGVIPKTEKQAYPIHQAIYKGVVWTWNMTKFTFWSISKLLSRDIPADQIAGPIGIMQLAGQQAQKGFVDLLHFIGLISVNLAILNLLPIPVLDGGHIVFYSLEAIMGKPVKIKYQELAQQLGIVLILCLMALAFYNDIARLVTG